MTRLDKRTSIKLRRKNMLASILLTCLTSITSGYGVIENEASGSILLNEDAPTFKLIADPAPTKTLESEDGYAFADLAVYKSPFTECSDLYLLQAAVSFTPGCVARANGSKQSNGDDFVNSYLNSGYFHLEVNDIDQGWRRSSNIAIKDLGLIRAMFKQRSLLLSVSP